MDLPGIRSPIIRLSSRIWSYERKLSETLISDYHLVVPENVLVGGMLHITTTTKMLFCRAGLCATDIPLVCACVYVHCHVGCKAYGGIDRHVKVHLGASPASRVNGSIVSEPGRAEPSDLEN